MTSDSHTVPGADSQSVRARHAQFLFPSVITYYEEPIVLTAGKGRRVGDADGREYLDFFGGILTVSIGHADDRVNAAVKAQVDRLSHVSTLYPTLPMVDLAETLARITPGRLTRFEETRKRGLLIGKGGLDGNVLRISPPLTVTEAEVDEALGILDHSFAALAAR